MNSFKVVRIVLVIGLACCCNSKPTDEKIKDHEVRDTIEELTKIVANIKLDQFVGDIVLKQYVDGLNDYTVYKLPEAGKGGPALYERKSNDKDKDAIVLLPSEDKISVKKNKKTYIGLRSNGADETPEYYVFYIYLRLVINALH